MPIIIRTSEPTLANVPFDTDINRKELREAAPARVALGASICAILHENALKPNGTDFKVDPNAPTLDDSIRNQVQWEIRQKKEVLLQAYPDLLGIADGLAQLDALPWPNVRDPHFTDLITKFKKLQCPAMGTGQYIGSNLVITAAHVVNDLGPHNMGQYRLVFNFTGANVPGKNVFSIRRIVHLNRNTDAPLAPTAHVFPPPAAFPINRPQFSLPQSAQQAETYDVAVLEILSTRNDQTLPKPLVLQPTPAVVGDEIFSIGCSHGLPFIYADGSAGKSVDAKAATVRRTPDLTLPPARQGSLTADIDVFKGNSGGPLFNAATNSVIGICRSGMIYPFLSDTVSPDVANTRLKEAIRYWIKSRAQGPSQILETDYLDFYTQLRTLGENSRISWIRFKSNSAAITDVNAFSRTDPYAFLTMPLHSYLNKLRGHLSIVVEITPDAPFNPFGITPPKLMRGDLSLIITGATVGGSTNTALGSTLMLPGGWDGNLSQTLRWSYTTNAPGVAPAPVNPIVNQFIGTLPNTLLPWEGGVCSWESISLRRVANAGGGYVAGEMEPLNGTITVQFMPPDTVRPGNYLPPFVFKLNLAQFARVAGNNDVWTTPLGARYGSQVAAWWTGPI
ncbi:trypsin-like cysteine/serine peptidase domain-containing protein [Nemania sp. FL0031]|nr:trypsin-like cysteine/serine peptidase domain-containing protein [Nemania sp. FL0031]